MCVELRRLGVNRQFLVEGVYMDDRTRERGERKRVGKGKEEGKKREKVEKRRK